LGSSPLGAFGSSIHANIIVNAATIGEKITYCNAPYLRYHKNFESYFNIEGLVTQIGGSTTVIME
jgi:hypothetical protein